MDSISLLIITPLLFLTLNKVLTLTILLEFDLFNMILILLLMILIILLMTLTILLKFDLFNMMVALSRTPAPLARTASTRWESVSTVSNHPL